MLSFDNFTIIFSFVLPYGFLALVIRIFSVNRADLEFLFDESFELELF